MSDPGNDTALQVDVPGARLHVLRQGNGPVLLVVPGGDGDADASNALTRVLAEHYTVVTYDRRGQARSPVDPPQDSVDIARHADDAACVLAAVTDTAALVFGISIGAMIGLELTMRHPDAVRQLIADEPPVTCLLPEPERTQAQHNQLEVENLYHQQGLQVAMSRFLALAGFDPADREPDLVIPAPTATRIANLHRLLTVDAPAVRQYQIDTDLLHAAGSKITVAAGQTSHGTLAHNCAQALAQQLATDLHLLPGGHSSAVLRPRATAHALDQLLTRNSR
jgi:pimeloyl-ACP methyl ester carboxylesterase